MTKKAPPIRREVRPLKGQPPPDDRRCTAKSKQRQQRCTKTRVPGMKVCRFHGGLTPVGADSPHYKGLDYSRHAPHRLADRITAAMADPTLMDLRNEAGLISAQIGEILEVLDVGGILARWRQLGDILGALRGAIEQQNEKQLVAVADAMDECLTAAADERGRWGELLGLIDQKRKLVETQAKADQRETLSMVEQGVLVGVFVQALRLVSSEGDRRLALAHLTKALELPERTGSTGP